MSAPVQDSPFVKSDIYNQQMQDPPKENTKEIPKSDEISEIKESKSLSLKSFFIANKYLILKVVIVILIFLIIYNIYCSYTEGFLQPSPKTGPEIDSKLDLEGEFALLNKMQETYFGKEC
jgi:hypothetical protein